MRYHLVMQFTKLPKLNKGDKVAIVSPSTVAPAIWPAVYELGLKRVKEVFELEPVEMNFTKKKGATKEERAQDLIDAFSNPEIKAVISTLGGDDQVTYIKNLPKDVFVNNPKPYFGFSDNTHFINHLWSCGVPAFYGGALFTEFAMQVQMDEFTIKYLKHALFEMGEFELESSKEFNDIGLNWFDDSLLNTRRIYQGNEGWYWDGKGDAQGVLWGGCIESIDEILRHNIQIPSLEDFENIVLFFESSEEIPEASYVRRVVRAFGERGILSRVRAIFVGRPKAWDFSKQNTDEQKVEYKKEQRETILNTIREYNKEIPVIQNMDFGHTAPQICLPSGNMVRVDGRSKKIFAEF